MERARNSDSRTHVKKLNWTSRTDLSGKSLCCIFLGHPVYGPLLGLLRWFFKRTPWDQKCKNVTWTEWTDLCWVGGWETLPATASNVSEGGMGGRTHKCPIVENPHTTCSGEGGSIRLHETQRSHFYFLTICCWSSRAKDTQTETKIQLCLTRNNRSQIKCAACQVSLFSTEWWKCFENAWGAGQRKPLSRLATEGFCARQQVNTSEPRKLWIVIACGASPHADPWKHLFQINR